LASSGNRSAGDQSNFGVHRELAIMAASEEGMIFERRYSCTNIGQFDPKSLFDRRIRLNRCQYNRTIQLLSEGGRIAVPKATIGALCAATGDEVCDPHAAFGNNVPPYVDEGVNSFGGYIRLNLLRWYIS
jgi:hypothetical protein